MMNPDCAPPNPGSGVPETAKLLLYMGHTGCIRPWRIVHDTLDCQIPHAARAMWRLLRDQGLVQPLVIHQHPAGWHYKQGRRRQLLELSRAGQHWYRQTTGREPQESEWAWALSHHSSLQHALAIRETRDCLRAMGIAVDEDPFPCPVTMADPFGKRSEPDLTIYFRQRVFPVEVQRTIRVHHLSKWYKSLELFHRLMLITFTLSHLDRQYQLLVQARQQQQLPPGLVLMSSLESFEMQDHHFLSV